MVTVYVIPISRCCLAQFTRRNNCNIQGQESNARIWITYAKCAMALGDRAGTERGLEKAQQFGLGFRFAYFVALSPDSVQETQFQTLKL